MHTSISQTSVADVGCIHEHIRRGRASQTKRHGKGIKDKAIRYHLSFFLKKMKKKVGTEASSAAADGLDISLRSAATEEKKKRPGRA